MTDMRRRAGAVVLAVIFAIPSFVTNFGELPLPIRVIAAIIGCAVAGIIARGTGAPSKKS